VIGAEAVPGIGRPMGTLRTIFAVSVVCAHSWPAGMVFVGGRNAVQLFYVFSGFLISYVLVESKSYNNTSTFYINRYLRLYPIYLVVAILSVATKLQWIGESNLYAIYKTVPIDAFLLLVLSNVFLLGQDWVTFSGIHHGQLVFGAPYNNSEIPLHEALIIPQAWTLGVELTFYLIAPFVLPKRNLIYALLFLSLAVRAVLINFGLDHDLWTYGFFPAELALFLLGALAQQTLSPFYKRVFAHRQLVLAKAATLFLVFVSIIYFLVPVNELYKTLFLFSIFIFLIPLTFIFQNRFAWDKWIGDLSYPIYIGHMLVIWTTTFWLKAKIGVADEHLIAIACVLLSIMFAIFLNQYIGLPFEALRGKLKTQTSNQPS
jgi:peptidoglycan/LPS O-acetylase OafA/YrhL